MPTKYLYCGELAVHYEHTGPTTLPDVPPALDRGVALLFVHGGGGNVRLWSRQLAHFGERHSPVAVDLPAHGRSGGLDGLPSVADAASLVADVLKRLGAPPAVVVGHGLGGKVALQLALDHADRVRGVVTIGTTCGRPACEEEQKVLQDVVRGRRPQAFDTPFFAAKPDVTLIREVWGEIVKTDPKVRLQDLLAYDGCDLSPRLAEISTPMRVLHGADDGYCGRECGEAIASGVANGSFHLVEQAGHVAHVEQAEAVNAVIEEFLEELSA